MIRSIPLSMALPAALLVVVLQLCAGPSAAAPVGRTLATPTGAQVKVHGASATMMMSNGETGTFNCTCNKGRGSCSLTRMPSGLICGGGSNDTCTGECVFFTTTGITGAARGAAITGAAPAARAP